MRRKCLQLFVHVRQGFRERDISLEADIPEATTSRQTLETPNEILISQPLANLGAGDTLAFGSSMSQPFPPEFMPCPKPLTQEIMTLRRNFAFTLNSKRAGLIQRFCLQTTETIDS